MTEPRTSRKDPASPTTPHLSVTLGRLQTLSRHQAQFPFGELVCSDNQCVLSTFSGLALA